MAYFLHYSKCYNITIEEHYGIYKENHTESGGTLRARKGIPLRFMPSFPYALQGSSNESRQRGSIHYIGVRGIWKTGSIRLAEAVSHGWVGRSEGEGRTRGQAIDGPVRYGSRERCGKEAQAQYQDRESGVGKVLRQTCERHYLPTFFRLTGARYKRIRKRPRGIPSPQLVEIKTLQLQELVKLWHQGYIDLRFGDESHVCTSGYVPYGWHFDGEDVFVPSQGKHRLNIFGMISPSCIYDGFDTEDSITGERLAAFLDEFSLCINKPTVIVLDNAAIHRKGEVAKMRETWKERGLYLFFLPPYCPHLNIAETLWRVLKGKWIQPCHYCDRNVLHETTREILAGIGTKYEINFNHAA